jgi:hypothetical protein
MCCLDAALQMNTSQKLSTLTEQRSHKLLSCHHFAPQLPPLCTNIKAFRLTGSALPLK